MNTRTALVVIAAILVMTSMILPALGDVGTGVLHVYTDTGYKSEATLDGKGHYLVDIGSTYYIRILGITEFNKDDHVMVKVCWKDTSGTKKTTVYTDVSIKELDGTRYVDVTWTVPPEAKVCETGTVHYKKNDGKGTEYVAAGATTTKPGHFHVIPENYLGPLGVFGAGALAIVAFATIKRRSMRVPVCNRFH
jgi:hypothetical protein